MGVHKQIMLPPIPDKRYFTIGETSNLCGVKPHVLRYWEQEFSQLKLVTRRGNRRYYQHKDVLLIRKIRTLLYEDGFTISGAQQQLSTDKKRLSKSQKQTITENQNMLLESVCDALEAIVEQLSE